jgi:hypothetical protein
MTRHAPFPQPAPAADPGRQLAQLREVLRLVESLAGRAAVLPPLDDALDDAARVTGAYGQALPVTQRRFDALTAETVSWAAAGVEALTSAGGGSPAAAGRLADELGRVIEELRELLRL